MDRYPSRESEANCSRDYLQREITRVSGASSQIDGPFVKSYHVAGQSLGSVTLPLLSFVINR